MSGISLAPGGDGAAAGASSGAQPAAGAAPAAGQAGATPAAGAPGVSLGNGSPVAAPAASGGNNPPSDPWAGLHADHKPLIEKKGWKSVDDLAKGYSELERAFGDRNASLAPKTPEEYQFDMSKLPSGDKIDAGLMTEFKKWAHSSKLSNEAAQTMVANFAAFATAQAEKAQAEFNQALTTKLTSVETALKNEWGSPEAPAFQRNIELARRAIDQLGIGDDLKALGAIVDVGGSPKIANAKIISALAKIGNQMFAEDTMYGQPAVGVNPFDPKTLNLAQQGIVYKTDPQRAKLLIQSLPPKEQQRYSQLLKQIG